MNALEKTQQVCAGLLGQVEKQFVAGAKITLLVRFDNYPERDFVMTNDQLPSAVEALERREAIANQVKP